jgi:hypothetical protein
MKKISLLLLLCCFMQKMFSQGVSLDAAQQQAIDKLTYAVKMVFNKLNNPDWVLRRDFYDPHMVISYQQKGAPLGVNNNYGRVYDLKQGSPTYQKLIQPLLNHEKALIAAKQYDSLKVIEKQIDVYSHFEIHANINIAVVNMHAQSKHTPYEALSIKGCAYCSKSNISTMYGSTRTCYNLLFGNWDTVQCTSAAHVAHYHFRHPEKTPFIENVDVEIIGDNDFISSFVTNSDWTIIANGLTI